MAVTESPNLPSPDQERPIGFGRLKRKEDARFIRGKGTYLDDIRLPGMVHGAVLRSPYAHARINSIDTSAALALPGVAAVITAKDLETLGLAWMPTISYDTQAVLAGDKVRFQGQEVAFVIATDEYIARDALPLIDVDYDPLPPVVDPFEAMKDKYLGEFHPKEVRVTVRADQTALVKFIGFPCGDFSAVVEFNKNVTIQTPDGQSIEAFIGGRDDGARPG